MMATTTTTTELFSVTSASLQKRLGKSRPVIFEENHWTHRTSCIHVSCVISGGLDRRGAFCCFGPDLF